jgi:hypothetical protein
MIFMAFVSKPFTALTILLLVDDAKRQRTDLAGTFVPELAHDADSFTISQLLALSPNGGRKKP